MASCPHTPSKHTRPSLISRPETSKDCLPRDFTRYGAGHRIICSEPLIPPHAGACTPLTAALMGGIVHGAKPPACNAKPTPLTAVHAYKVRSRRGVWDTHHYPYTRGSDPRAMHFSKLASALFVLALGLGAAAAAATPDALKRAPQQFCGDVCPVGCCAWPIGTCTC